MTAKLGDRIDFGSAVEPCGGVVAYIDHQIAVIRWDAGGDCIVTLAVLETLSCGGDTTFGVCAESGEGYDPAQRLSKAF